MNFDLSDNQSMFRDTVERFCSPVDVARRHAIRRMPGGLDRARWIELAELGLIALAASERDGGLGGSLLDCAIVAQALGERQAIEPWLECGFLTARLLTGTQHVAAVLDGSALATLAFAEAQGRYTLDARSVTVKDGKISGEKTFVACAATADRLIVTAAVEGETRLFTLPCSTTGVDIRPYPIVDGSVAGLVAFHQAQAEQLGSVAPLLAAVEEVRLLAAAEMVGLARRLFDDTLDYVKTREQFGQPLGRFQVIQHRLVDCYAKLEAIQSALYRGLLHPGTDPAATKAFVAEGAIWIGEQAVQLHGGMGMTDELAVGHAVKRILLLSRLFGDPASAYAALAKAA